MSRFPIENAICRDLMKVINQYEGKTTIAGMVGCMELIKVEYIMRMLGDVEGGEDE